MLKPTKILVPTDFSEHSDRALRQALDIAKQYKAKVFVLHVVHGVGYLSNIDFAISAEMMQLINNTTLFQAQERLQEQLESFAQVKEVEVNTAIREGVPDDEILKEAKKQGADLIVIASLGRSGVAKYLIGNVARNVLKGATCPVLLTK